MPFSFLAATLEVMVALYLFDLKAGITIIGLLLSLGPLSFMVIRMILASMADSIGTKMISLMYGISRYPQTSAPATSHRSVLNPSS